MENDHINGARRYHISVPAADESVIKWLASQHSISSSLRHIIRQEIQRNGYIDARCSPVYQLPKRGRPVSREDDSFADRISENEDVELISSEEKSDTLSNETVETNDAEPGNDVAAFFRKSR